MSHQGAGWHPDPAGRWEYRYWDGQQWTEHVAANDQRGIDPPEGGSSAGRANAQRQQVVKPVSPTQRRQQETAERLAAMPRRERNTRYAALAVFLLSIGFIAVIVAVDTVSEGEPGAEVEAASEMCRPAPRTLVDAIDGILTEEGLTLSDGQMVKLPPDRRHSDGVTPDEWPVYIFAAQINGTGLGDGVEGAWAVGARDGKYWGSMSALNSDAREWTQFTYADVPGFFPEELYDELRDYPEVDAAVDCVE